MSSIQDQVKAIASYSSSTLLDEMKLLGDVVHANPGTRKVLNSELWHACAGPLVSLPQPGSLVYYFPQGHSEQVTASTRKTTNSHIPNYPGLPSQLMCQVHNVTLHADRDTDEIYAQMTLQPVNSEMDVFPIPDFGHTKSKQPTEFFCKNLTASDTSTHGGFSVPRRAAEKLFPQLDYTMQPPNQELIVRDLHDNMWTFRHIYRGQPKRHLLTTGWSLFVGAKRLKAGDSILFIRDVKSQLLLGVRRVNRQQTALPSSVLSADSMHMGVLAAAAHAAASRSPFTVYYNPRACPSEFIIPLAKYHKAAYTQVSVGMRFGMMFETEESTKRRYMGTIVGISDFDPLRWPNSKWRNLQVEWDEHGYAERPNRVSLWEIDTPESFFVYSTPSVKRPCLPGFLVPGPEIGFANMKPFSQAPENVIGGMRSIIPGLGSEQLLKLLNPQNSTPDSQLGCHQSIYASILQKIRGNGISRPTFSTSRSQVQEALVNKEVMQQNHQLPLLQQSILPLQNILLQSEKTHHSIEQLVVDLDSASGTQVKQQGQLTAKSITEQNSQDKNEDTDNVIDHPENKITSSLLQETVNQSSDTASGAMANQGDGYCENKVETPLQPSEKHNGVSPVDPPKHEYSATLTFASQELEFKDQDDPQFDLQHHDAANAESRRLETSATDNDILSNLLPHDGYRLSRYMDHEDWMLPPLPYQSVTCPLKSPGLLPTSENATSPSADISSIVNPETLIPLEAFNFSCIPEPHSQYIPTLLQEFYGAQPHEELVAPRSLASELHELAVDKEGSAMQKISKTCGIRDLSDECNNQNECYGNLNFEVTNGNMIVSSCVSGTMLEAFSTVGDSSFHVPSEDLFGCITSNNDMQSQVTSASLVESQGLSIQDIPDSSGGTSSGSIDVSEYSFLTGGKRKHVSHLRTYTKVQRLGSVGRSIDVTRFRDYSELKSAIACMFGLEGQLDDPRGSEWKLVYVDYENDVLLVGDDPWEEFVSCVRCIRILSPSEVQQMSAEGMQLLSNSLPSSPMNIKSSGQNHA